MERKVQIRIPCNLVEVLQKTLAEPGKFHEPVVFGLANSAITTERDLVLIKELIVPPEAFFVPSQAHGAKWSGALNIELMNRCSDVSSGLFVFHRHPGHSIRMSADDRQSAVRLIPYFQSTVPQRFHGSVVLGDESVAGMVWRPNQQTPTESVEVRLLGRDFLTNSASTFSKDNLLAYRRMPLVYGPVVKHLLANTRIAVVGLSGGGSQLATQFAALGFGEIVAVDPQRFDYDNRFSTDAPWAIDLALRAFKTSVVRRHIFAINPRCLFRAVRGSVPSDEVIKALRDVDIIVGCVNNLRARSDLLELAGRYGIPLIDIGFQVGIDDKSEKVPGITSLSGNVFTIIPGGPCMWCTGFLTRRKLENEVGGQDRSYVKLKSGRQSGVAQAAVLPFNGLLASSAVTEALQLVLGFNPYHRTSLYRKYDGLTGQLVNWEITANPACSHCENVVHAGDPVWN